MAVAYAGLDRHRQVGFFDHGGGDSKHFRYILQNARAGTFARHFAHGAAPVDVDEVGFGLFHHLETAQQFILVGTKNLYTKGSLLGGEAHLSEAFFGVAVKGFGGDELGDEQIGPHFLAQLAEGEVGDVVHGGEPDGESGKWKVESGKIHGLFLVFSGFVVKGL